VTISDRSAFMSSILHNAAALSALQSLQMTQQALGTVQNQVSSGLSVASAADNSSYWSIATQLNADSGMVTAANSALSEGQSVLATASSAINSVITTLNSMQSALTQAQNPGANIGDVNTSLASLSNQLTDAVNGASFNGLNVLNGSQSNWSFVSGFHAGASGGSVNTISFTASALYGLATAGANTTTTSTSTVSDATSKAQIEALVTAYAGKTTAINYTAPAATYSTPVANESTANAVLTVQQQNADGSWTTTSYTALDANGNSVAQGATTTLGTAKSFLVTTTNTTPGSQNLLVQNSIDLTNFTVGGAAAAKSALTAVNDALSAVTNYAAAVGATQDRMTTASNFNSGLTTNYANGVAGLVDANMNQASTRLQALQTQEQLGIQSLAMANQNAQLVLKLFG
jgi:flagellin